MAKQGSIQLGDTVKDSITGMKGVVYGITTWLNGCETISVQSRKLKDGRPVERVAFDTEQLELVERKDAPATQKRTGGDPQSVSTGRDT